jgi:hypothetical protein
VAAAFAAFFIRHRNNVRGSIDGGGGADVDIVTGHCVYQLIRQRAGVLERICKTEFLDLGVAAYAVTFG